MKLLRLLIPAPLHRLDLHLQQRFPRLWSTRIHHHLWFLLLVNAVVFGLGLLLEVAPSSFPDPEDLFGYMLLPAFLYFACWVYQVVLFSPEKRSAPRNPFTEVGEFLIHLVSILLIMTIPYTLALTAVYRIAHTVGDREFTTDVNDLNRQAWAFIIGDGRSFPNGMVEADAYISGPSSHQHFRNFQEYLRPQPPGVDQVRRLEEVLDEYRTGFNRVNQQGPEYDPAMASWYRTRIDSIEQQALFLFVEHGCFSPDHWDYDRAIRVGHNDFLSDSLLELQYVQDIQAVPMFDTDRLRHAIDLGRKYGSGDTATVAGTIAEYHARRSTSSTIRIAGSTIQRIHEAKTGSYWFLRWVQMAYSLVIPAFILTILLSIFKSSYWQPFLIMLAVCILLPVVILIAALILSSGIGEDRLMLWTYYVIALGLLIVAPGVMGTKAYHTRNAVVVMLANLVAPFMIAFTLFLLHEEFDVFGLEALQNRLIERPQDTAEYLVLDQQVAALRARVDLILTSALWGGLALYALLLVPLFRTLHVRLFALPETR
ncbi:MAG TPA: hypothetical protein VGE21_02840 [Flavobacteriales bacterium]